MSGSSAGNPIKDVGLLQDGTPVNSSNPLNITGSLSTGQQDKTSFVEGTATFQPIGGVVNDSMVSNVSEDNAAAVRITPKRAMHVTMKDEAGASLGTSGNPLVTNSQYTLPAYVIERGALNDSVINISFGATLNVPAWPGVKPLTSYIVPQGKTCTIFGIQYKTSSSTNGVVVSSRKPMWKFATALANPATPTLAQRTLSGAALALVKTYRYKVAAVSTVGETAASAEASITLTGTNNAVTVSWTAVTGAMYYNIYRTVQNGATNTQQYLAATETTSFVDAIPDSGLLGGSAPTSNTSGGSIDGQAFPSYSFANIALIDTLAAITAPTALDIVYKNINDQIRYIATTPLAAAGDSVAVAISNTLDPGSTRRIPITQYQRYFNEIGISDVVGVGNLPATGAFNIYGYQHYASFSSVSANKFDTYYFDTPIRFAAGSEIVLSVTSNAKSSTATRNDGNILGYVE